MLKQTFCFSLISMGTVVFAQQKISGRTTDEGTLNMSSVLVVNITNNASVQSDDTGRFAIDAKENDEVRFVKEGYYRTSKKITREDLNAPLRISLKKMEIEIAEVKIKYNPTGNLAKDNQYLNESMKLKNLKSELGEYMLGPLNEPLPDNTVSKTFTGHDFKAGQVDLLGVFRTFSGLVKKATKPKITKASYFETQDFLARVKREINLDFLKKYGMDEEQIDKFLLYANGNRLLAKKNRKDFQIDVIEYEIKVAFAEYKKLNNLEGSNNKD
ncbi:hypothetical protein LF887_02320 [Chryseobacterium sp. MEBOG06]|uniref:hypothetical protein n=1 Tax=Chryseobacterium sp. MEBOG06 TaxID=2879938 RepID=UPI001F4365A0|nr:hypothetical protein [Chryseobacterium sp. MEBOG06]UKB84506.1 hypothetical protein LF887_02320 [Chryseobacterium sp. MEBOG06]